MIWQRRLILLVTVFVFSITTWAAQIKAVKGKKILIDMQTDTFRKNDLLKIFNTQNKYVGLAKVTRVKGNLAEALLKGKAEKGFDVKIKPVGEKIKQTAKNNLALSENKTKYGIILGYNSSNADIKLPGGTKVSLSGSGFSVKGLMDFGILNAFKFRGLAGLEQFVVGGKTVSQSSPNGCGGECTAEINYLTADLWGRYSFGSGSFRPWLGIGVNILFPLSKDSTAIDEDSITTTSTYALGGGFDFILASGKYIPIQIEYNIYPSTDDVSADAMTIRAGFTF